jgi:hypothetical protein
MHGRQAVEVATTVKAVAVAMSFPRPAPAPPPPPPAADPCSVDRRAGHREKERPASAGLVWWRASSRGPYPSLRPGRAAVSGPPAGTAPATRLASGGRPA